MGEFIEHHGVTPLLHDDTASGGAHVYRDSLGLPEAGDRRYVAAEMLRDNEFRIVIAAIHERLPVKPLVFKGQALAHTLYPRPWLRPRHDVDLLVPSEHVSVLVDILKRLGYRPPTAIDGDLIYHQTAMLKTSHGRTHKWDVHWKLSNRPALADILTYTHLSRNGRVVNGNGTAFLAPARVDDLLIACLHLIGHHTHEMRLLWLYDIFLLSKVLSPDERRVFVDAAVQSETLRAACQQALSWTRRYLPNEFLVSLIDELSPRGRATVDINRSYAGRLLADARVLGFRDKVRFARQHAFPTTDYMTARFGVRRRWLLPFWYAVRIGRAVPKMFKRG